MEDDRSAGKLDLACGYIDEMMQESLREQIDRRESLRRLSESLLTCISIVSVVVFDLAPSIIAGLPNEYCRDVLCLILVEAALLVVTFLLTLVSLMRLRFLSLESPEILYKAVNQQVESHAIETAQDISSSKMRTLQSIFEPIRQNNDRNCTVLRVALAFAIASVSFPLIAACIFMFVAIPIF